jgi:predicted RNase H-like HicB family nuclease
MSEIREHYVVVEGYVVLIEQGPRNCSAFIPDLPGCYAFADTIDEIVQQMQVGIPFHIEGLERDGDPVPAPVRTLEQVIAEQRAENAAA